MNHQVDMANFIAPKSDQLNADDLIAGPITVTITGVSANESSPEQPISIAFKGDEGKPYKPCKSMRRVMVHVWGADASKYVGRSMTLYRDPKVQFGGMQVGGIRISHMTHIDEKKTMALTATRASRKPFTVHPLDMTGERPAADDPAAKWASAYIAKLATFTTADALNEFAGQKATKLAELETARPELHGQVAAAIVQRRAELTPAASGFDDDDLTGTSDNQNATDAAAQPDNHPDPLRSTLRQIEDAKTLADIDKIDGETEAGRAFLSDAQCERLDEALAARRSELRAAVDA